MKITVRQPSQQEIDELITQPTWSSPVDEFDWHYDMKETAYIIEGQVTVSYNGEETTITKGDLAIFPQGMSCVWKVTSPLKKHYKFG